jgi:hypothetical protein
MSDNGHKTVAYIVLIEGEVKFISFNELSCLRVFKKIVDSGMAPQDLTVEKYEYNVEYPTSHDR